MKKKVKSFIDKNFNQVLHTTFNPNGPGVVRIHLIPSNDQLKAPSLVIVNGSDIIPINKSWAFLLAAFINNVNEYDGKEVSDEDLNIIVKNTIKNVKKLYKFVTEKHLSKDLWTIIDTLSKIAYREELPVEIGYMTIDEYAPYMDAPHRMDLMVSAMTKNGQWHCNQKCVHCYAAGQTCSDEPELSTEQWKNIIDECRTVGIAQLTFTGGEPTMRNDLIELISHSRWFITRLNTNGVLLTEDYCKQLKESEVDNVQITFYSDDKDIHNKLVGANNFEKTVNGIKNAVKEGLSVSINTPLCSLNKDYGKTLKLLKELGVIYVTCSGLILTGNAVEEESQKTQLRHDELLTILTDSVNYCNKNKMEIGFTSPGWLLESELSELGLNPPSCGACLSNMAITPSGKVVPCQSWLSDGVLGDFLQDNWSKIWNSEKCKDIRTNSCKMLGVCPLKIGRNNE